MPERRLEGKIKYFVEFLALLTTIFALQLILIGPILGFLRVSAIFMLLVLIMAFILYPARAKWEKVNLIDVAFMILALIGMMYIILNYDYLVTIRIEDLTPVTPMEILLGTITIITLLEASRRIIGLPMSIILLILILYAIFGKSLPPPLTHSGFSYEWIIEKVYLTTKGIFGLPISVVVSLAYTFVLYGVVLEQTGVIKTFLDFAYRLFGKTRGASAKSCITAGTLVGMASGLPMSTTYVIGMPTIPEMIKSGYKPHIAGAIAAVTGTAAQIMPPVLGVAAFVVAQMMNVHYIEVAKMSLIPALLFYFSFFLIVHFEALKHNVGKVEYAPIPLAKIFKGGFYVFLISIGLLVYLLVQFYPAGLAAFYASLGAILIALIKKENRNLRVLYRILVRTGTLSIYIAVACAAAGVIIALLVETGLNIKFTSLVMTIGHENLGLALILSAIAVLILGMGMPSIPAYITGASIFVPALAKLGISPAAAHMFCFYYAILYSITPPVAFATYAGAQLAKADMMKTGFAGVRLGFLTYVVPFLFVFNPALLLITMDPLKITTQILIAIVAVFFLSLGLAGYFLGSLRMLQRILLLVAGLLMIIPYMVTILAGLLLGVLTISISYYANRKIATPS
ncbi:MAG: TRAP transporter fused permease subunit [Archaeoglobaceae archaeon]|nr:TRAP transporter fused permease subunit [Archaeoglobaceae archaeon]MDW8127665.1 TRAP transporter fused permease subunit [Archaeoglobaceae archaeon]